MDKVFLAKIIDKKSNKVIKSYIGGYDWCLKCCKDLFNPLNVYMCLSVLED